jgi:hypothetical protein
MIEVERKRSPERKQRDSPLKGSRRWANHSSLFCYYFERLYIII